MVSINHHHSFRVVAEIEESKGGEREGATLRSKRKPLRKSKLLPVRYRKTRRSYNIMDIILSCTDREKGREPVCTGKSGRKIESNF